jgi:putative endonuclease
LNGKQAERWAAEFLQQQGLTLLEQNFRSRFGEIDLIMQDEDTLVFVEVRQRSHTGFGGAVESVDAHKQKRLISAAKYYLAKLNREPPCRFDVVLMDDANGRNAQWIRNAFEVTAFF